MLTKFLRGATGNQGSVPIEYVGGYVQGFVGSSSNINISLTSLTGGLASAPAAGDFVLVYFGNGDGGLASLTISTYSQIALLNASDTNDTNLVVGYKFMGATPDTTVTFTGGTASSENAGAVYISVWRNVDTTSPLDVTSTTATGSNSVLCNPPAITPVTAGSYIVSGGSGGHAAGTRTYSSSNLTDFLSAGANDVYDVTIGGGYNVWTSGSFDPAQFTFSTSDSTAYSWAAVTVALRPA